VVASSPTAVVSAAQIAPSNSSPPTITGTASLGQTLTASTGGWSGSPAPSFSYQWQDCNASGQSCTAISGATSQSHVLSAGDVGSTVDVVVTASNSSGSAQASSAATASVTAPPQNTAAPSITGTATQGQTLSASPGTWSGYPAPSYAYQWQDCNASGQSCTAISGATNPTYTLAASDAGKTVDVVVTASNSAGSAQASSAATGAVAAPPQKTATPTISGSATEAQTLTASNGSWSGYPAPTFSYQWQRCNTSGLSCTAISAATSQSYTVLSGDVGSTVLVVVTATNTAGSAQATSQPTAVVSSAPGPVTPLLDAFTGSPNSGPPDSNWTHMIVSSTNSTSNLYIVSSGQVTGYSGTNADYWNLGNYGPNSEDWITVAHKPTADQDPVVLGLRFQNPGLSTASGYQAYYIFRSNGHDQWKIIARTNGTTSSTLASANSPTLNAGDEILFRAIGTTIELWRLDAGTWTKILSATDTTFKNAGYLNLTTRDNAVRLTNFGGGTLP
jgi:hypothetical protein